MKFKFSPDLNTIPTIPWALIQISFAVLAFGSILLKPPLSLIRTIAYSLRIDFWPIIPITALILYLIFRIPRRAGQLISLGAVMLLFAMPLAGLWSSAHSQTSVLSGLIQLNDARGYYADALRLAEGQNFSYFSTRRPLFPGFLSVLLIFTHYNLMVTLAILSAITAFSCYLMAKEIQRTYGAETATFLLMMLYLYYRLHSGNTMSENYGIAIGTLGFTTLWMGTTDKKLWLISLGLFTTTIALNARAGAFFVLPALVIWTGWLFSDSKKISWKAVTVASVAVALGFISNLILGRMIGQPDGIPFANFSYTLYSLAAGGKSWAYIAEVHPEVFLLPEPAHTKRVFQLAFELMREKPLQSVQGAIFFWKAIFTDTLYNVFSFVAKESWNISPIVKWLLYFLSLTGFYAWFKDKKSAFNSLIAIGIIGIYLSVPLVPPTDSFRMRPYAASIVMICILPATGFGYLTNKLKPKVDKNKIFRNSEAYLVIPVSILLLFATIIGPIVIKKITSVQTFTLRPCPSKEEGVIIYFAKGTNINILKNTEASTDWPPNYHAYLFQKNIHGMADGSLIKWAETLEPGTSIMIALDVISNRDVMLITPVKQLPKRTGYVQFCGNFDTSPSLLSYSIFYAQEEAIAISR